MLSRTSNNRHISTAATSNQQLVENGPWSFPVFLQKLPHNDHLQSTTWPPLLLGQITSINVDIGYLLRDIKVADMIFTNLLETQGMQIDECNAEMVTHKAPSHYCFLIFMHDFVFFWILA